MLTIDKTLAAAILTGSLTAGGIMYAVADNTTEITEVKESIKQDKKEIKQDMKDLKEGQDKILYYLLKGKYNETR